MSNPDFAEKLENKKRLSSIEKNIRIFELFVLIFGGIVAISSILFILVFIFRLDLVYTNRQTTTLETIDSFFSSTFNIFKWIILSFSVLLIAFVVIAIILFAKNVPHSEMKAMTKSYLIPRIISSLLIIGSLIALFIIDFTNGSNFSALWIKELLAGLLILISMCCCIILSNSMSRVFINSEINWPVDIFIKISFISASVTLLSPISTVACTFFSGGVLYYIFLAAGYIGLLGNAMFILTLMLATIGNDNSAFFSQFKKYLLLCFGFLTLFIIYAMKIATLKDVIYSGEMPLLTLINMISIIPNVVYIVLTSKMAIMMK